MIYKQNNHKNCPTLQQEFKILLQLLLPEIVCFALRKKQICEGKSSFSEGKKIFCEGVFRIYIR